MINYNNNIKFIGNYHLFLTEKEFVMIVLQNSRHKTTDIKCI